MATSKKRRRPPAARVYRWCWYAVWLPLGLTSTMLGLAFGSIAEPLASAMFFAVVGAWLTKSAHERFSAGTSTARFARIDDLLSTTSLLRAAAWAGLAGGAVHASVLVVGAAAWPLLAAAVLTSPWVLEALGWDTREAPSEAPAAPSDAERPGAPLAEDLQALVRSLSDAQLLRAWQESLTSLKAASTDAAASEIVAVREAYLTELERRRPNAAPQWLANLAESSADPEQWLRRGPEDDAA